MKIAVAHPGKLGDAIYALPAIRWLYNKHSCKIDFWTSSYCDPLRRLFEYQSCIRTFNINESYEIHHMKCGVQPYEIPILERYDYVYQAGYRGPPSLPLYDYISESVGAPKGLKVEYEFPNIETPNQFVVFAPKANPVYEQVIATIAEKIHVVQIGAKGEYVGSVGQDLTGLDFLETTSWLSKTRLFAGCLSSQLVLADGFDMPKIVANPSVTEIMNKL